MEKDSEADPNTIHHPLVQDSNPLDLVGRLSLDEADAVQDPGDGVHLLHGGLQVRCHLPDVQGAASSSSRKPWVNEPRGLPEHNGAVCFTAPSFHQNCVWFSNHSKVLQLSPGLEMSRILRLTVLDALLEGSTAEENKTAFETVLN